MSTWDFIASVLIFAGLISSGALVGYYMGFSDGKISANKLSAINHHNTPTHHER